MAHLQLGTNFEQYFNKYERSGGRQVPLQVEGNACFPMQSKQKTQQKKSNKTSNKAFAVEQEISNILDASNNANKNLKSNSVWSFFYF